MREEGSGKRLTIFVSEYDRVGHHPLVQVILERAREEGLAVATVLRAVEGFGASGILHTTRLLSASDDLPMIIEIVDRAQRIDAFLPILDDLVTEGLVTVEPVDAVTYRGQPSYPLDEGPGTQRTEDALE